jgi:hypothetical protein
MSDIQAGIALGSAIVKSGVWASKRWKCWLGAAKHIRSHVIRSTTQQLHEEFVHALRDWTSECLWHGLGNTHYNLSTAAARSAAQCVERLLELPADSVHCSIKIFLPGEGPKPWVETIGRSSPRHAGCDNPQPLEGNTAFKMIDAFTDGDGRHRSAFRFFSCPDLSRHSGAFQCTRPGWEGSYCTTVVLPMRVKNHLGIPVPFGFVTFDSLMPGAFGLPDVMEFRNTPTGHLDFWEKAKTAPVTHMMGLITDSVATMLAGILVMPSRVKEDADGMVLSEGTKNQMNPPNELEIQTRVPA